MATLARHLIDYDSDLLLIIASQWDLDPGMNDRVQLTEILAESLALPGAITATWERLTPEERAALHELKANDGHQPFVHFTRRYGDIRAMGPARREREKPWLKPITTTESLYYRGLIYRGFEQTPSGMQEFAQVPDELIALLPEPEGGTISRAPGFASAPRREIEDGYETAVDDVTTLLAYLLIHGTRAASWLTGDPVPEIDNFLRHPQTPAYRVMLTQLAIELGLIASQGDVSVVNREGAIDWLKAPRLIQQKSLIKTWRDSIGINELMFTPGLEADEWPNDPRLVREAVISDLADVPQAIWWNVESFIEHIKQTNPDFQRPGGDYTSWYIRDAYSDQILDGLKYWDYIEGALLNFLFKGPLRWLGIIRRGSFAFQVTDAGAALVGQGEWPSEPDDPARITVDKQGTIRVPVTFSRYHRVQVARFASWIGTPAPSTYVPARDRPDGGMYEYRLTTQAIRRAQAGGFEIAQILAFLQKHTEGRVPRNVTTMLTNWAENGDEVTVEDVVIIETLNHGVFARLKKDNRINALLEEDLGANRFTVKRDDLLALLSAVREAGFFPLFKGHKKDDLP